MPDHLQLIVAANRDEFHGRASLQANFWVDAPHVLAGRDEVAGGTWLGCTRNGRFAALTNFSGPGDNPAPASRGELVQNFLVGHDTAADYAAQIEGADYAGFNLLIYDGAELVYTSNKAPTETLTPGFYGLSNAELGAQWPKCVQGAQRLKGLAQLAPEDLAPEHAALVDLLADRAVPPDDQLPQRGRDLEMERRVAPCFILGDEYGTRASTVVAIFEDHIEFSEQLYAPAGKATELKNYVFDLATD